MISLKRRELIEELLLIQDTVTVAELVDYLQVSTATIRRDLLIMEKEGLLIRMHGGIRRKRLLNVSIFRMRKENQLYRKHGLPKAVRSMSCTMNPGYIRADESMLRNPAPTSARNSIF